MNRRNFLSWLGVGAATVAAAPLLKALPAPEPVLSTYADYVNFSDLAISSAIDESVENAASQLAYLAAADIRRCVEQLKSREVKPFNEDTFVGCVNPELVQAWQTL